MIEGLINMKAAAAFKGVFVPVVGAGTLTMGAILGTVDGVIQPETGIALGFVGGLIVATASAAWFFRGLFDTLKNDNKNLAREVERLKKKVGLE
jgi:hypothetical protein